MSEFYQDPNYFPEESQPQQANKSDAVYADYVREKKVENLISQINPDNILADVENRLKGFRKDVYSQQWIKIANAPEVHPLLVGRFISFLGAFLNNNVTLSNYTEHEINKIMFAVIEYVIDDFRTHSIIYGIHDYSERTRIGLIICSTVFATLKRAMNGSEASRLFKSLRIGEQLNPNAQKDQSMLSALKFWK
jgi:hypothetical protein